MDGHRVPKLGLTSYRPSLGTPLKIPQITYGHSSLSRFFIGLLRIYCRSSALHGSFIHGEQSRGHPQGAPLHSTPLRPCPYAMPVPFSCSLLHCSLPSDGTRSASEKHCCYCCSSRRPRFVWY